MNKRSQAKLSLESRMENGEYALALRVENATLRKISGITYVEESYKNGIQTTLYTINGLRISLDSTKRYSATEINALVDYFEENIINTDQEAALDFINNLRN
jgi:hypothetical protein